MESIQKFQGLLKNLFQFESSDAEKLKGGYSDKKTPEAFIDQYKKQKLYEALQNVFIDD